APAGGLSLCRSPSGQLTVSNSCGQLTNQQQAICPRLKYLLRIYLSCLDGQPSCPGGEAHDSTQRCEGPAAVPVAGATAAHGAALRATPWPRGGRETMRGQCQDDSALAGAVAARRRARAGTT